MMAAPDAPLLALRDRNNSQRWCTYLPRSDMSLASFLVKVSDVLVNGMLSLNVFGVTYFLKWGWGASSPNDDLLSVCSASSIYWKAFVFGLPFVLYLLTVWISGIAKSAELDLRGLTTVSVWVLLEIIWVVVLGAVLTHCVSGAPYIHIFFVAVAMISLLMVMWGFTFNHPRCLRRCCSKCCCCGLDLESATAEASNQVIAAEEWAAQVARAQAAFAVQVRFQNQAAALREELGVANDDKASAEALVKTKAHEATLALKAMQTAEEELTAKDNAAKYLEERIVLVTSAREQALAAGQANTELEQVAKVAEDRLRDVHAAAEKEFSDAKTKYENASTAKDTAEQASKDAYDEANRLTGIAQDKLAEVANAEKLVKDACISARAIYEEAVAAQSVARLVG